MKATLERLVDFDRINAGEMRFSVGAVNVRTGNFVYFDTTTHHIGPEHVMASGSLPPGFPATEIDGEFYWDGGLVSNTPLQWVLDNRPRQDTLAFQVDLWSARGELPRDLIEVGRAPEGHPLLQPHPRRHRPVQASAEAAPRRRPALEDVPRRTAQDRPEIELLAEEADDKVYNIIQLIYHAKNYEGSSQGLRVLAPDHGGALAAPATTTPCAPCAIRRSCSGPTSLDGVFTFDLAVQGRE